MFGNIVTMRIKNKSIIQRDLLSTDLEKTARKTSDHSISVWEENIGPSLQDCQTGSLIITEIICHSLRKFETGCVKGINKAFVGNRVAKITSRYLFLPLPCLYELKLNKEFLKAKRIQIGTYLCRSLCKPGDRKWFRTYYIWKLWSNEALQSKEPSTNEVS